MVNSRRVFKPWVPEWLIWLILFIIVIPSIAVFFLPITNINASAGYYGAEPTDMQFAVALFYGGYVGFYILERRFFNYVASKAYFLFFIVVQICFTFVSYQIHELAVFLPLRFAQGLLFGCVVNVSLSMLFSRIKTERAREVSFSIFFGLLLCALPLNNLLTADLIDSYNFNIVYKAAVFAYLPGLILILTTMNGIRLTTRLHLYKLDWQSFLLYTIALCSIGYIMIYGQEYYWLDDTRIRMAVVTLCSLLFIFIIRQRSLKRPYIHLEIFKYRNFTTGLLIMFVMYICRFASGLTNSYFAAIFHLDPIHVSYINVFNISGLVVGVLLACILILKKINIRMIWLAGFVLLLYFHAVMYFRFDVQANEFNYFMPLTVQGLGVGLLMVPTIVFTISSVPVALGASAAAVCLAVRYLGFIASIALQNFLELYEKGRHFSAFRDTLSGSNSILKNNLSKQAHQLTARGMNTGKALKGAQKLLYQNVSNQSQIRYSMDYYEIMSVVLLITILMIAASPFLNKTVVYLKSKRLSPF